MRILYTDTGIAFQKYGGVSRYFCEIIQRIERINNVECDISALFFNNEYFCNLYDKNGWKHFKPIWKEGILINRLYSVGLYWVKGYDLIHHTYFNCFPEFFFRGCVHVITVHDMIPEMGFIDDKKVIRQKKKALYSADHIIAVSECTKRDILKIYPDIPEGKITVIYHGSTFRSNVECDIELPSEYILFVGHRFLYKNFERLLYVFYDLSKTHKNLMLVCVGGFECSKKENEQIIEMGLEKKVRFIHGSDEVLAEAYGNASCFVYPSLYEGFGIPILEAWSCKCPVVLSNASCFPEIAGDAAAYFDPYSHDSMLNAIEQVLTDQSKRKELVKLGTKRLEKYDWDIAAKKTLEIYTDELRRKHKINEFYGG